MSIVEFSLRRRVTVAMAVVAAVMFGIVAFSRLHISLLPELAYPTITVETKLPGAAPAEVEQLVTRPIEERIGVVSGARRVASVSRPGISQVVVEFGWGRSMDFAAIDIREKLDTLRLPDAAESPRLLRFDPSADPVLRLVLAGDLDPRRLRELAEEVVEKDLESAEGVAAIEVRGGLEDEIEVEIDPSRATALGLDITQIGQRLAETNVDQAGGSLYEREARYIVRMRTRFESLDDIRETILFDKDGRRVKVSDVAEVRRGHAPPETITRYEGAEAVELAIFAEGDANLTSVADAVQARLEGVRSRLPGQVELVVVVDQSRFIRTAVDEVISSAITGGLFAVLVLMLFLRDIRSTLVVAASIPVSVVATFFLMHQFGTTLNVMSLGGLALGVGMLVDNAIVVLESIFKHAEREVGPLRAAIDGASEVASAVVASTLTTVAVFVPVVFLEGIAAQLFGDMALTVCFSLLVSLAVSLTLIPMLCATMGVAGSPPGQPLGRIGRVLVWPVVAVRWVVLEAWHGVETIFHVFTRPLASAGRRFASAYPRVLIGALRQPGSIVLVAIAMLALSLAALPRLGLELVPSLSRGEFAFEVELAPGSALDKTDRVLGEVVRAVDDPRIERVATIAGQGATAASQATVGGEQVGRIEVALREGSTAQDEAEVAAAFAEALAASEAVRVERTSATTFTWKRPIELEIYGENLDELRETAALVARRIESVGGVEEVRSSAEQGNPEIEVRFDREALAARSLDVAGVADRVRRQLQGDIATRFREVERDIDIRVRAGRTGSIRVDQIESIIVGHQGTIPIVLSEVADVTAAIGPEEIRRIGQRRAAVVSADVRGRDIGSVAREVEAITRELELPVGVTVDLAGQEDEMDASVRSLLFATALAAFLVYLVMASQFESFLQPLIVITSVPLAAVGVIGALLLAGERISVVSLLGVVMLAGIVVNNAIVLVDAINRRRQMGAGVGLAIVSAARDRLRPIAMTTATTVLGLVPMALGTGPGAELRRGLAVVVAGGLTSSTLLTLVVVPCIYALAHRRAKR